MAKRKKVVKKQVKDVNKLTQKQRSFCLEYIKDKNGTQAAIRAGYSKKTAMQIAEQNLRKLEIQHFVKNLLDEIAERSKVTAAMIAEEYKKIAFANVADVLSEGNEITDIKTLDRSISATVEMVKKTVTEFEGGTKTSVQVKLHSKIAALDSLAKHLGFFEKDNNQKGLKIKVGFNK